MGDGRRFHRASQLRFTASAVKVEGAMERRKERGVVTALVAVLVVVGESMHTDATVPMTMTTACRRSARCHTNSHEVRSVWRAAC